MSVSDAEKAYYESVLAGLLGGVAYSLSDLRYTYFLAGLDGGLPAPTDIPWANITGAAAGVETAVSSKTEIAALTPLADPATATSTEIATLLNAVINALKA